MFYFISFFLFLFLSNSSKFLPHPHSSPPSSLSIQKGTNLAENHDTVGLFVFIRLGARVQRTNVVQKSGPNSVEFGEEFVFMSDGSEAEVLVIGVVSQDEQHFFGQV